MTNNIAFAWGRMNPMHKGHELVVKTMADTGYESKLYLSHKQDRKTDPLDYDTKIEWAKKSFSDYVDVVKSDANTMLVALSDIYNQYGSDTIIHLVAGSDRRDGQSSEVFVANKYNGVEGKQHGYYNFKLIKDIPAGENRLLEDDIDVRYASGKRQRSFAAEGNLEEFIKYCPSKLTDEECEELYNDVRRGMGLVDTLEELHNIESTVDESVFSKKDILKLNHDYFNDVINYILENGYIKIGNHGEIEKIIDVDSCGDQLRNLIGTNNISEFDRILNKYGVSFTKIFKGIFSGHMNGQSAGEDAERLVVNIYNGDNIDYDRYNSGWVESSQITADFISMKWPNTQYTAVQVNDGDLSTKEKRVAMIYKSKENASKVLGLPKGTLSSLYVGDHKDDWNKADILLVKNDENPVEYLTSKVDGPEFLNISLDNLVKKGIIIPISLKKVGKNPSLLLKDGSSTVINKEVVDSYLELPSKRLDPNTNNASCYIHGKTVDGDHIKIQFRRQSDTFDRLSIEDNSLKLARGGKGVSKIYRDLDFDYSFKFKDEDEAVSELQKICPIRNNLPTEPSWYNRTAFRGIVAVYNSYVEKYHGDGNSFVSYLHDQCTIGSTMFYLVS